MGSLFKSSEGKQKILNLYKEKLEELNIDSHQKMVDSSFGKTNIIITGDATKPPLIIVHGSNACAPISLETYPNLSSQYQVFAVDVPAQPNKSEGIRMSMKNEDYGKWMNEIMDTLGLKNVTLVGFSFGGLVILKTLIYDERNVKEVFLASPAYIVNGNPLKAIFKVFIPMRRYMWSKKVKFVEQFLSELFTDRDKFAVRFLAEVFLHFEMDFSPVPTISKADANKITTPITLIAAKNDLLFPGEKMIRRAETIFSSIQKTVLLEHSKHVQSAEDNRRIEDLILNR